MKNLRQLLQRAGLVKSKQRRSPTRSKQERRQLISQSLEKRELLAADGFNANHNYWHALDVTNDQVLSARDALVIMNHQAKTMALGEEVPSEGMFLDTNNSGHVSSADALAVMNGLQQGEEVGELVEYFLTARDENDNLLPKDGNGNVLVDVNEKFFLELSYVDKRTFGGNIGAFQIFADLEASQADNLKPVLRETQRLLFDEAVRTASSGSYLFSLEGSGLTYESQLGAFGSNPENEIRAALNVFGYQIDQYDLVKLETGDDNIRFQIRYTDPTFGNVDLPDISVADNFDVSAPVTFTEFAPFEADGVTPNAAAVRFNIDARSRTYPNNSPFYGSLNDGGFNSFGFDDIGGTGGVPTNGGGIPELGRLIDSNYTYPPPNNAPFDALRVETFFMTAANGITVTANPGERDESLLLYGRNEPVTSDFVLLDEDATLTFIVGDGNVNTPPNPGPAITATFDERDPATTIDLLAGASDADLNTLSIINFQQTNADDSSGITLNGSILSIDPSAQAALNTGQSVMPTFSFDVFDGTDAVGNTATITINGFTQNRPPTSTNVTASFNEDQAGGFAVDLLANANDLDNDILSVTNITVAAGNTGRPGGISTDVANNQLLVTPTFYGDLNTGQTETITFDVAISDGNGGTATFQAIVTIDGITDNVDLGGPVLGTSPLIVNISEDDANSSFDLRTDATDPDDDPLTVSGVTARGGSDTRGTFPNGNFLDLVPNNYNSLKFNESVQAIYDYTITDGNNPAVAQVVTVTISGVNDAPTVSNTVSASFNEDDAPGSVSLLQFANDVDGDTLSVTNVVNTAGNDVGITVSGNSLSVTPSAYGALLSQGQNENVDFTFTVTDGNGGSVNTSARVTIIGADEVIPNRNPVLGTTPLTQTFSEDDASATLNLLFDASDPDNDTLSVGTLSNIPLGVTANGSVSFNPGAYNSLSVNTTAQASFSYPILDGEGGSTQQSFTITVNGVNDAPTVSNAISRTFNENDADTSFSLLQFASDPDTGDTLNVSNQRVQSGDGKGVMVVGNSLQVSPGDYADDLDAGQRETIVVAFDLIDGNGGIVAQTATVEIIGTGPFPPTNVTGTLFIDELGPNGDRNGSRDAGEDGLSGIKVHLRSLAANNSTGQDINLIALTDADGTFLFPGVQPGTFEVEYEIPDDVVFIGSKVTTMVLDGSGGTTTPPSTFSALGTRGDLANFDIIASSYLRNNGPLSSATNGGVEGGQVSLDSNGGQRMIILEEGFDNEGIDFVEFTLNTQKDAGLLTIVQNGVAKTAQVGEDHFIVSRDGLSVRFFGGFDDFVFLDSLDDLIRNEFPAFLESVDIVLGTGN